MECVRRKRGLSQVGPTHPEHQKETRELENQVAVEKGSGGQLSDQQPPSHPYNAPTALQIIISFSESAILCPF